MNAENDSKYLHWLAISGKYRKRLWLEGFAWGVIWALTGGVFLFQVSLIIERI